MVEELRLLRFMSGGASDDPFGWSFCKLFCATYMYLTFSHLLFSEGILRQAWWASSQF